LNPKTAYIYTHTPIVPFGSGTQIRQFTNVRAYLDLGYDVEVIQFTSSKQTANPEVILPEGASHTLVQAEARTPSLRQRLAYQVGFPLEDALGVMYVDRQPILDAVKERERAAPGAIHHFEYSGTANVAISLRDPRLNLIWSCHDWESDRNRKVGQMRHEAGRRKSAIERLRRQYFSRRVETQIARHCKLVLMIADHETRIFREQLGIQNAELLPMSWPDETMPPRARDWRSGGVLRLLHVGSPHSMVGYYSLKFILGEVFPLIPEPQRASLELLVIGQVHETGYSRTIRELAAPYPQVKFLGYVDDLMPHYASADVHLVGASLTTGLRTRIIESFVRGVPVLSTSRAAEGIAGLSNGTNILLADSAPAFAQRLIALQRDPSSLGALAAGARNLYDTTHSRPVAARRLKHCLETYI
jgi:hypothetical protein